MKRNTRPISWIKAARKDFGKFPPGARKITLSALTIAAEGEKADIAKPLRGIEPGVFEVALRYRNDAYRLVYALKIDDEIWVLHAFQKKSTKGIRTSKKDVDLIKVRIRRLKEYLK